MDRKKKDFFISYTESDQTWAEWIAWQLEDAGYTTILQAWDFLSGSNFVHEMQMAMVNAHRVLAILSPQYLQSAYCKAEWAAVFADDPTGENGKLIPVRIKKCELQGLHKAIVYIDLVKKNQAEAKSFLLIQVQRVMTRKRQKPEHEPTYPGQYNPEPRYPGALPDVWKNVPKPNPNFTGRDQILQEIRTSVSEGKGIANTRLVLHGLGGIGKSQLAAEYCYRNSSRYDVVWWIRAEKEASLRSDYTSLASKDALDLPEQDAEEQDIIIRAVRHWLDTHHGWLLAFDNAWDAESIDKYLPDGMGGHVLITSRNSDWKSIGTPLNVGVWKRNESIAFLRKRTGQETTRNADALAQALGDLPLALEQAAAYIYTRHKSLAEYLELFESRRKQLWDREQPPIGYPDTVGTTWTMAFEAIDGIPYTRDIMLCCSVTAPDAIPKRLINDSLPLLLGNETTLVALDSMDFDDAVVALCSYSLITVDTDTFSIHRLVQVVAQDRMGQESTDRYQKVVLKVISEQFPQDGYTETTSWPECEMLLPHSLWVLEHKMSDYDEELIDRVLLLNGIGTYYQGRAVFDESEPLLRRSVDICEKTLGEEHLYMALSLNNLAELLNDQGKYGEAEALYRRSLKIRESMLGAKHLDVAISQNNLGLLLQARGKYEEAGALYRRSLKIRESILGIEHLDVATSLNNLGLLQQAQGKYEDAEKLYLRSLKIRESKLDFEHLDVAKSLNNLGLLMQAQGKYEDAEKFYQRSLKIGESKLGAEHPDVAQSLNNLAESLRVQGNYIKAEPLFRQALKIWESRFGIQHPNVAATLNNLALLLQAQSKYEDAEDMFYHALKILESQFEPEHPDVAMSLHNLTLLLQAQGKYEKAEELSRRSLQIRVTQLGDEHPDVAMSLNNLALLLQTQEKLDEAEPLFRRSLQIRESKLRAEHPDVAESLNNVAESLRVQGKYKEAEDLFYRAIKIWESQLGSEHPNVATALNNLALLLQAQGKLDEAEPLFRRALAIVEKHFDIKHQGAIKIRNNLAALLSLQQ